MILDVNTCVLLHVRNGLHPYHFNIQIGDILVVTSESEELLYKYNYIVCIYIYMSLNIYTYIIYLSKYIVPKMLWSLSFSLNSCYNQKNKITITVPNKH